MRSRLRPLVIAAGLCVFAAGNEALAQPSPDARAAAAALFEDGKQLMSAGKYQEACPKLEESQKIDPGMGTLYNLALCYESIGRTASAWVGYRDVAAMALAANQSEREKAARGKAASLEPKLIKLKITVQQSAVAAGVEVKRDGAVVSPALWGTPVPLDPGKHTVSATAAGREPWEVTVALDQPGNVVSVEVPPLLEKKAGAALPPALPRKDADKPPPPSVEPAPAPASPRSWQMPLGVSATAVGAVGLGLGVAFGFLAKSTFDESNTSGNCDKATNKCNEAGLDQRSSAVMKGNLGTGLFIGGAVLAAGGVVLWITAPKAPAKVGLTPGGVTVRGSF